MENIFRIAFLMLFLSVGLQGLPTKNFRIVQHGIKHLQKQITCPEGTVFYAPSPADVEKSIAGALACSIQQLNHLNNTLTLQHHINNTLALLQATFVDDITTDSSECSRENPLSKKSCKDFMKNMTSLAEALSAKYYQS